MSSHPPTFSQDEMKELLNEALALEYVRLKKKEAEAREKPAWWLSVLQSSAFAAFITILFGTIGGTIIANHVQTKSKEQEEERVRLQKVYNDQQKAAEDALTAVARIMSASQDLIDISGESWNEEGTQLPKEERQLIVAEKRSVWKAYNSATGEWRVQRERLGFVLAERHDSSENMQKSWQKLVSSVDAFALCAAKYNSQAVAHPVHDSMLEDACNTPRTDVRNGLKELSALVLANSGS